MEIDQIVAEFHACLPREQAKSIGAIYARYSTLFQHSIGDQVRALFEGAVKQGIFIPRENIFCDLGVRGYKNSRPGLDRLRAVLAGQCVQVLMVFTTNRLYRKVYKALQFVEEELIERNIRCIFLKSNIDTADAKNWRMLYQWAAMQDELSGGMYGENVRAAHEGLFAKGQVFGTITFGYRAQEVDGPPTKRQRPRTKWEIDPEAAPVVQQVFHWYTVDKLPIATIIRRLNADDNIPLGPKCVSGQWSRLAVIVMLTNPRYRGLWAYGKTQSVWQNSKDYARSVLRPQPLREAQFEHLRILTDEVWFKAQQRMADDPYTTVGRKPKNGDRRSRPLVLNSMFFCQEHDQRLHVAGFHGHSMTCPLCFQPPIEKRALFSYLNRELAQRVTCQKLADLVRADASLVDQVVAACQRAAVDAQRPDPKAMHENKERRAKLTRQISLVVNNLGDTQSDHVEAEDMLRRLRAERSRVDIEIGILGATAKRIVQVPTEAEVQKLLERLAQILTDAACSINEEEVAEAGEVIRLLTGGRIELTQQGDRKSHRGWLQGRFRVRMLSALAGTLGVVAATSDTDGVEVVIDYKKPSKAEQLADVVKQKYDQGMLLKDIAQELRRKPGLIGAAVAIALEKAGLPKPDHQARLAAWGRMHGKLPPYQKIAPELQRLLELGRTFNPDYSPVTSARWLVGGDECLQLTEW